MARVSAASVVWLVALFVIEVTGSSSWRMGAVAEDWTGEELAKLDSSRGGSSMRWAWSEVTSITSCSGQPG